MGLTTRTRERLAPTLEHLDDGKLVVRDRSAPLERLRDATLAKERANPARGPLVRASAAWMMLTFLVAYIALPAIAAAAGSTLSLVPLGASFAAFAVTAAVVLGLVYAFRPSVRLPGKRAGDSGPEIAATAGSLFVWAAAHELLFVLEPLHAMAASELLPFAIINLVEHSLFGVMLASFTRSAPRAFAVGVAFQLLFLGLTIFFFAAGV